MSANERRHFSRVKFHFPAELVTPAGLTNEVTILDISMRGALVKLSSGALPQGELCSGQNHFTLRISLSEIDTIEMEVIPAHCHEHEIGLRCLRIDLDSIMHLRSLIEANLGDPDMVNRELANLIED